MLGNRYPAMHTQVAARVVDGAAVIVLADSGMVQVLDEVGTRVWELIDGVRSVEQIALEIEREYEVSLEQASLDVAELVQKLVAAEALVLRDTPAGKVTG